MVDYTSNGGINCIDDGGENLQEGFYMFPDSKGLFYFTGNYDEFGLPIFEREIAIGNTNVLPIFLIKRLHRIDKKGIEIKLKDLKEKVNWLEEKLQD
ncbi:MAG: hypothetical protein ABIE36_02420 [Candidatus Diapherotrites archaeon]